MMNFDTSRIPVTFHKPNQIYQIERNTLFGDVDDRTAKILSNLSTEEGIRFQIYCRTISRRAASGKKGSRKPGANELQYVMNTIIYGPEDLCNEVGLYLAKCGVYLQEPIECDRVVLYSNPQFLSRTGERVMTDQLGIMNTIAELERIIAQDDIFSELSCDDHLSLTDAPDAIGTPLYR
jgi:SWI/SNF-related matrix-associated actin-dependent regulator of chromatin subfamily A3